MTGPNLDAENVAADLIARAEATPVYDLTPLLNHNRIVDALGLPRRYRSIQEWDAMEAEFEATMHAVDVLR